VKSQLLLDIFTINSYAISCTISPLTNKVSVDKAKNSFLLQITSKLPATLWSLQVLKQEKFPLLNDFEVKVLESYARNSGLSLRSLSSSVSNRIELKHIVEVFSQQV
jgi:hypothetical protein